jgi:hypothetical protein
VGKQRIFWEYSRSKYGNYGGILMKKVCGIMIDRERE